MVNFLGLFPNNLLSGLSTLSPYNMAHDRQHLAWENCKHLRERRASLSVRTRGIRQVSCRDIGNYAHGVVIGATGLCGTCSFSARATPASSQRGSCPPAPELYHWPCLPVGTLQELQRRSLMVPAGKLCFCPMSF